VALAWSGYSLNLFNLIPVGQLDGGRIVTAISPRLWIPGFLLLWGFLWQHPTSIPLDHTARRDFPHLSLFRNSGGEDPRYYEMPAGKRLLVGAPTSVSRPLLPWEPWSMSTAWSADHAD
jgi:membrane-associated protease RseP (regulator of RpoE activity)